MSQAMQQQRKSLIQKIGEWRLGREFIDEEEYNQHLLAAAEGIPLGAIIGFVLGMSIFFPEYFFYWG